MGNARFEGICVDIIDELAKELNFNYSFHLNPDDTAGTGDPVTKKWNGMIGELLDGVSWWLDWWDEAIGCTVLE